MLLQDKVAIITGGSRGIGREIALSFVNEGAKVVVNYVNSDEHAMSLSEEIKAKGGEVELFKADISNEDAAKNLIDFTISKYQKLDILVNNAGVTVDKFLISMSLNEWEKVIKTNLTAPFLCSKFALRKMMKNKKGKIVNVSSLSGILGNKGQANYAASKAGIIGLTKTIAQEYAGKGINANVVAPGVIDTDMTRNVPSSEHKYKLEAILKNRPGKAGEVAGAALFLASDLSDFVNGEVLRVDGGIRF
jgi:3-oxoacyl-[acyl-carrier protein] reductase